MQVFSARLSAAAVLADAFSVFPAGGFKVLPTIEEAVDCLLRGAEEKFRVFADVSSLAAGEGGARIAAEAAFLREERRDAVIDQNRGLHEPGGAAIPVREVPEAKKTAMDAGGLFKRIIHPASRFKAMIEFGLKLFSRARIAADRVVLLTNASLMLSRKLIIPDGFGMKFAEKVFRQHVSLLRSRNDVPKRCSDIAEHQRVGERLLVRNAVFEKKSGGFP